MDSQPNPPFSAQRPGFTVSASASASDAVYASSESRSSSSLSTMSSAAIPIEPQQFQTACAPIPPSSPAQQTNLMGSIPANTAAPLAIQLQFPPQQAQAPPPPARSVGHDCYPNRDGSGQTAQETVAFLNEYSLVAEAAKRAQMAVIMRDMEAVELS